MASDIDVRMHRESGPSAKSRGDVRGFRGTDERGRDGRRDGGRGLEPQRELPGPGGRRG